jgi:hypothetical protein
VKEKKIIVSIALGLAAATLTAQSVSSSSRLTTDSPNNNGEGGAYHSSAATQNKTASAAPFSRIAIGGNISTLGPNLQITTNIASHLNLRATGNALNYSTTFSTNGFDANAKLNMVSAGVSADIFPFRAGFRISPGVMVVNNNRISATAVAASGTSFDFDNATYYSASTNAKTGSTPLNVAASLGLNTTKPAFTVTTGWGNTIPRKGHWSFPFELGVAFTGQPSINVALSGWACQDAALTQCGNVNDTTNSTAKDVQASLNTQIAKWKNDLDPLKTYPILSFGVAYSFRVRGGGAK